MAAILIRTVRASRRGDPRPTETGPICEATEVTRRRERYRPRTEFFPEITNDRLEFPGERERLGKVLRRGTEFVRVPYFSQLSGIHSYPSASTSIYW